MGRRAQLGRVWRWWAAAMSASVVAASLLVAAPAGASPLAAAPPPTTPATTAPGTPPTTVAPAIPAVSLSVTDGQPAGALLARAESLTSSSAAAQPALQVLGQETTLLDEATVTVQHATQAAARAKAAAAADRARAAAARRSYDDLDGVLRAMAVRMYETDTNGLHPAPSITDLNEVAWSGVYANATVDPHGLLGERRATLEQLESIAAASARESALASRSANQAAAALAQAAAAEHQLRQELGTTRNASASAVAAERVAVAQQAGRYASKSTSLQFAPSSPIPPQVSTVDVALQWAFAELGKPYLWGGTGPGSFDCSGLTQYVWRQAGVSIPRVAADQDTWAVPVPLSQLLPGDLVFFGTTNIHHVGIYIGDGLMINAPHTGAVVSVTSIWWSDLAGFGRVHTIGTPVPTHALPTPVKPAPAQVIAAPGPVPSQTAPPPGWKPAPGSTAPLPGYADPASTTTTAPSGTTTSTSSSTTTSTTTTSTTTTVPGAGGSTTSEPNSTTSSTTSSTTTEP